MVGIIVISIYFIYMLWWDLQKIKILNDLQISSYYWPGYLSDHWEKFHQKVKGRVIELFLLQTLDSTG